MFGRSMAKCVLCRAVGGCEREAWNAVADSGWFYEKLKGATMQRKVHNPFVESGPPPWIQRIIDQGGSKAWGYIIYCSGLDSSEAWLNFRTHFDERLSLVPSLGAGSDDIIVLRQ